MTAEALRIREVEEILKEETCKCAAVPTLNYEYGVIWIECPRDCHITACAPDGEYGLLLAEWKKKTIE